MTATSPTSPNRIDSSCRLPLFTLFGGAAIWLVLSSGFGLAASMTFHKATMFADCTVGTYGRAYPAWSHLLIYGFALPSGLGVGLWLLARLGRVELAKPFLLALGAKLWHLGVLVGLIAVINGPDFRLRVVRTSEVCRSNSFSRVPVDGHLGVRHLFAA